MAQILDQPPAADRPLGAERPPTGADGSAAERTRSGFTELFEREKSIAASEAYEHMLEGLDPKELRRILRPQAILGTELVWPLSIADASAVLQTVSENQLRDWDAVGLIAPVRWGKGDYRGYFRSHLVQALMVSRLMRRGWSVEALRHVLGAGRRDAAAWINELREVVAYRQAPWLPQGTMIGALDLASLKTVRFLKELTDSQLARVARSMELRAIPARAKFAPGKYQEPGLYLLLDGIMQLHDNRGELQQVGAGVPIGEFTLFGVTLGQSRLTLEAVTECIVGVLSQRILLPLMSSEPELAIGICRGLAFQLTEAEANVRKLIESYPELADRIAYWDSADSIAVNPPVRATASRG